MASLDLLVTGGTGFVGKRFCEMAVARGLDVVALVRRTPTSLVEGVVYTTISDLDESIVDTVSALAPKTVMHFATHFEPVHSPYTIGTMVEVNILLGTLLLEGALHANARFVYAGSAWQYLGPQQGPNSLYAATKKAFSEIAQYYQAAGGSAIAEILLYNTFGRNDTRSKLIPYLLKCADTRTSAKLRSPETFVDLCHVDDVVQAFLQARFEGFPELSALSGQRMTVGDVVDEIRKSYDSSLDVSWSGEALPFDVATPTCLADRPDGWSPTITLEDWLSSMRAMTS